MRNTGMDFSAGNIYHVYNQGNNRQRIFNEPADYYIFLKCYEEHIGEQANTIAWSLMPNHFHFLLHTDARCDERVQLGKIFLDPISNGFRELLSRYAINFNNRNKRTGSLFRQKTKAVSLTDIGIKPQGYADPPDYIKNCFHYIHQNSLRAGLVSRLEDWPYSSYIDYAGYRESTLCRKDLAELYCGYDPATFIEDSYVKVNESIIACFKVRKR